MTSCQSASAWFISSANAATSAAGTCGSAAPWQARILAVTAPGRAGRLVARLPWMLTTPARSAPDRASASAAIPPKQNPTAAAGPATSLAAGQRGQAGLAAADEQVRVVAQGEQARHYPLPVPRDTVAEHIAGQHGVAEGGITARLFPCVRVKPGPAVNEKDSRPWPFLAVIPAELAGQRGIEVAVRKVTGRGIHAPKIIIE